MVHRRLSSLVTTTLFAVLLAACGGSPAAPKPPVPPPPVVDPPANIAPTIDSIAVQGRRPRQPARFADLQETIDVTANVRDPETSIEELTYQWTATAGTFTGSGRVVTWTAPDTATTPTKVTITLKVIENYGHPGQPKIYSQEVSATAAVALHDSHKEVGDMSREFLIDFSTTSIKDWRYIMRNFNRVACPDAGEVDLERIDVENHYTNYVMHNYRIEPASVTVNFGGVCPYLNKRGDACAAVGTFWDSTEIGKSRKQTTGVDHLTAAYSSADSRWWLCSSYFQPTTSLGHSFYSR